MTKEPEWEHGHIQRPKRTPCQDVKLGSGKLKDYDHQNNLKDMNSESYFHHRQPKLQELSPPN